MVDFWGGMLQSNRESNNKLPPDHKNKEPSDGKSKPTLFRTVLNSGNDFITELHSKLNAALSLDDDEDNGDDDDDDDSIFEAYTKNKQRDSGGDFGGSSSTASDLCIGGSVASSSSRTHKWPKSEDFPKHRIRQSSYRHSRHSHKKSDLTSRPKIIALDKPHRKPKNRMADADPNQHSDAVSGSESASEAELNEVCTATTTSMESPSLDHSASEGSLLSWTSSISYDSQADESTAECMDFMKQFVDKLFQNKMKPCFFWALSRDINSCSNNEQISIHETDECQPLLNFYHILFFLSYLYASVIFGFSSTGITLEEKAKFGELCRAEVGRLWFSRYVNTQRVNNKKVGESTFYSMVQYFAICLFECAEADDYTPAKSLMNMCFTFYHEVAVPGCEPYKEFLYLYLKEQPIWQSLRFWNAAFFDAVQCERAHKPVATREDLEQYSPEEVTDEKQFQENITFGQLGSFTCNMHAFGLSRELCLEFLRKQSTIANLRPGQVKMLRENIERMYRETRGWRK